MTFFIIDTASISCSSVMMRGGANRMILSCVGFASKPLSLSLRQRVQALASEGREREK